MKKAADEAAQQQVAKDIFLGRQILENSAEADSQLRIRRRRL
jgi:hypothetical protein